MAAMLDYSHGEFLLWLLLLVVCWPVALFALIAWPVVWLLLLPFRLIGIAVGGVFALLRDRDAARTAAGRRPEGARVLSSRPAARWA